jgi:DNA-directed RNA polymerase subunit RPC12/RpoP
LAPRPPEPVERELACTHCGARNRYPVTTSTLKRAVTCVACGRKFLLREAILRGLRQEMPDVFPEDRE